MSVCFHCTLLKKKKKYYIFSKNIFFGIKICASTISSFSSACLRWLTRESTVSVVEMHRHSRSPRLMMVTHCNHRAVSFLFLFLLLFLLLLLLLAIHSSTHALTHSLAHSFFFQILRWINFCANIHYIFCLPVIIGNGKRVPNKCWNSFPSIFTCGLEFASIGSEQLIATESPKRFYVEKVLTERNILPGNCLHGIFI